MFNIGAIVAKIRLDRSGWDSSRHQVSRDLAILGAEFGVLGGMITGALSIAVRRFGRFDKAIREATAVTTGITRIEFEQMSAMAQDMSVALNLAATETSRAFYYLGSAGLSAAEQMDSFNATITLARAITEDTAMTAEGLVDIMKAFQIEFSRSDWVANQLVKSVITSNQVFADLDAAMSYASSTMRLMNNTIADTAAVLGVMANAGIKGCYDDQTEVLVRRGWIPWSAATMDDEFATLQPDTNMLEYQRPTRLICYRHSGPMYHVANRGLDLCVTPDHRMWVRRRDTTAFEIMTASEVDGREVRYQSGDIGWAGNDPTTITLPGFTRTQGPRTVEPMDIDAGVWATFLGWYISEGSCDYRRGNYRIRITQNPGPVRDRMREVLAKLPVTVNETKAGFTFANQQIWNHVEPLGKSWEKRVPDDAKNWSPRLLQLLLDALLEGDGDCNGVYYTSSHQLADDVMEIALKAGHSATMGLATSAGSTSTIKGREVRAVHDQWKINTHRKLLHPGYNPNDYRGVHGDRIDGSRFSPISEWVDYDGEVFCAEVPNHLLIVRRNGKPVVSGNSMAGVALRRSVTNLMSPTREMRDLLRDLGVNVFDLVTGGARPFIDVMGDIEDALKGTTEQYRNMALEVLFGRRAIAGMINVLEYGADGLRKYSAEIANSGGTMKSVTDWQMAAFLHQLGRVGQMIQRVSRLVGESLAPRIRAFADLLGARVEVLREWMEAHRELVAQLALTVAKIGLLLTAIGALTIAIPIVALNIKILIGLLTSPLLWAVGAVVVAFYLLRSVFNVTWDGMGDILNKFANTFEQWGKDFAANWEDSVIGQMGKVFKAFINRAIHGWVLMFRAIKLIIKDTEIAWGDMLMRLLPATAIPSFWLVRFLASRKEGGITDTIIGDLVKALQGEAPDYIGETIKEVPATFQKVVKFVKQDVMSFKDWLAEQCADFAAIWRILTSGQPTSFGALVPKFEYPDIIGYRTVSAPMEGRFEEMLKLWRANIRGFIEDFESAGTTITSVFEDMQAGWETAIRGWMQHGGSFRDFMTQVFDSVYQSFVNFVAKMAAQGLATAIFGPEDAFKIKGTRSLTALQELLGLFGFGGPPEPAPGYTPGLQMSPRSYTPSFEGSGGAGKIAVNIINAGPPVELDIASIERTAEGTVLNASMKLATTNAAYRRTFVNPGVR